MFAILNNKEQLQRIKHISCNDLLNYFCLQSTDACKIELTTWNNHGKYHCFGVYYKLLFQTNTNCKLIHSCW